MPTRRMQRARHKEQLKTYGKYACIGLAVVLLSGLFLFPLLKLTPSKISFMQLPSLLETPSISGKSVVHPVLQGLDNQNQFFNITASHSTQVTPEHLVLDYPTARLDRHDAKTIIVTATHGDVMIPEERIILNGNVQLHSSDDEHMHTETATIYLQDDRMTSNQPVHITSPKMDLTAQGGVEIREHGMRLSFTGPVKVVLLDQERK
jgi:LPS export ABC transporter protein LptC